MKIKFYEFYIESTKPFWHIPVRHILINGAVANVVVVRVEDWQRGPTIKKLLFKIKQVFNRYI